MKQPNTTRRRIALAAGAGAVLSFLPDKDGRAQGLVKMTAAEAVETLYYLPLYVAHALGFFKEQGLDVTIFNAQQRTIALRAIVAGDAFTYNGDPAEPALARLNGAKVKNIGVIVNRAGGALLAKKGTPKDPKQWRGKRIITPRPPHTSVSLTQLIMINNGYEKADADGLVWKPKGGADKDAVRFTPVVAGSELSALAAGQADLSFVLEPNIAVGVAQGFEEVKSFAQEFGEFFYTSFAVTEESIEKRADQVQKFVNAMEKAMLFGHKHPDKAAEVAVKRYDKQDPKVVAAAALNIIRDKAYPESMLVSKAAYDKNFDMLLTATGHQAAKYPMAELMDNRFAEKAKASIKL
jgi:NitT/TauT family transport system substrate-binding protein